MDHNEPLFDEEDIVDQCDQIRAIASKNWLSSAYVSLAQLDQVKTKVYNVGLVDKRDLKATKLTPKGPGQRSNSYQDLSTSATPPLNTLSYQKTAWGSNNSIPELLSKYGGHSDIRPQRPESAKTANRRVRPPSGKKPRPGSAKVTSESSLPPRHPKMGVKGAKYDPSGRPPKQCPQQNVTLWVGPPAGMKYPDIPTHQAQPDHVTIIPDSTPSAPSSTPVPKLHLDVDITGGTAEIESDDESDEEEVIQLKYSHGTVSGGDNARRPQPEEIHFSLPTMNGDEEDEDSELDTERLLQKANAYSSNMSATHYDHNDEREDAEESSHLHVNLVNEQRNGAVDNSPCFNDYSNERSIDVELSDDDWLLDEAIAETSAEPSRPLDKISVTFLEEKNVTIAITPRNQGYKVTRDLSDLRKKVPKSKKTNFVVTENQAELEEQLGSALSVKSANHMTPGMNFQTDKIKSTVTRKSTDRNRPKSAVTTKSILHNKVKPRDRPSSAAVHSTNRQERPVTTVMVDFGDDEDNEKKMKKVTKKVTDRNVVTMMQGLAMTDSENEDERLSENGSDNDVEITPELLRPGSPTKLTSEPVKNYYEVSRQSVMRGASAVEKLTEKARENPIIKTTKTIELGEDKGLIETTVKSVLDTQLIAIKEMVPQVKGGENVNRVRPSSGPSRPVVSRPSSGKIKSKPPTGQRAPEDEGRPGSRLGFIAMAPDSPPDKKMSRRPFSGKERKAETKQTNDKEIWKSDNTPQNSTTSSENTLTENEKSAASDERLMEIHRLMEKHLKKAETQLTEEISSYMSCNGSAKDQTLSSSSTDVPEDSSTVSSSTIEPNSVEKIASKIKSEYEISPSDQREKDIDNLIQKHLNRPPSVFTVSPMTSARSSVMSSARSSSSPLGTAKSVTKEALSSAAKAKKKASKSGLNSPKSTLVSEQSKESDPTKEVPDDPAFDGGLSGKTSQFSGMVTGGVMSDLNSKSHSHSHHHGNSKTYAPMARCKSAPVRKKSAQKVRYTKPMVINTKRSYEDMDTPESEECVVMQAKLASKGVNISAKTLERALFPPSGHTTYYEINATLPKTQSHGLLSHPKVWLPEEYKQLRSAEKALDKVNEILYLQKRAEARKAKAAEGGTTTKKKKKPGKKKGSAMRRSKTSLS